MTAISIANMLRGQQQYVQYRWDNIGLHKKHDQFMYDL